MSRAIPAGPGGSLAGIYARSVDRGVRAMARLTPWVEGELLGLRHVVRPGDVCMDIGAGMGLYTAALARLASPHGTVHSVEPLRFAHPVASAALRLRHGPNIRHHEIALGDTDGTCSLSVPVRRGRPVTGRSFRTTGTTGLGSNREFDEHIEVSARSERLDRFCARLDIDHVDFLKVDVEGAEPDVLRGGGDLIERARPRLLLEIEERHMRRFGRHPASLVTWLADRGYRMFVWHGTWRPRGQVTTQHRNYLFSVDDPESP